MNSVGLEQYLSGKRGCPRVTKPSAKLNDDAFECVVGGILISISFVSASVFEHVSGALHLNNTVMYCI